MKYTIEGFSQRNALAMKLSLEDLLFLRWFIDFKENGTMKGKYISDANDMGYWVNYKYVMSELPILFSLPPHLSNENYKNCSFEEKKKLNKNWIYACKKKLQRILSGNLSKVLIRDIHKENIKNEKGKSQINSYVYLYINKDTYKYLIKDNCGLYKEPKLSSGQKCPAGTSGQKCPAGTSGQKCPVYPSTNPLNPSTIKDDDNRNYKKEELEKRMNLYETEIKKGINKGVRALIEKSIILEYDLFAELIFSTVDKESPYKYLKTCIDNCIESNEFNLDTYEKNRKSSKVKIDEVKLSKNITRLQEYGIEFIATKQDKLYLEKLEIDLIDWAIGSMHAENIESTYKNFKIEYARAKNNIN